MEPGVGRKEDAKFWRARTEAWMFQPGEAAQMEPLGPTIAAYMVQPNKGFELLTSVAGGAKGPFSDTHTVTQLNVPSRRGQFRPSW